MSRAPGKYVAGAMVPAGAALDRPVLDSRLGGPHNRSGRCGVEKNIMLLPGIEPRPSM
jgi:hypothetical protein